MHTMRFGGFASGLAAVLALGCAQGSSVDVEAESASIRAALDRGFEAVAAQGFDALRALTTDDFVHYNHMGTEWSIDDMQAFFADHISEHSITISDVEIEVAGDGSMAWARFSESTQYKFDGNPVEEQAIFTAIFEKSDGEWKMSHLHRSAVPPGGMPEM